jgi:hypothetical protein
VTPVITTGLALPVAAAMAAVYATNTSVTEVGLAAAEHTVFVDGTRSPFLTDTDDPPGSESKRLGKTLDGLYRTNPDQFYVDYPGTLGIISILSDGLGAPTFDDSEQAAVDEVKHQVDTKSGTILIVGYSQGASAVVRAIDELESEEGYDGSRITVVLVANPRRNDGGLLTRLPNFTLPLVGATFGDGTNPHETTIIQVTKQYDGVADAPVYILNPLADVNAILGYAYLHGGYYQDVEVDPVAVANDPSTAPVGAIVTRGSNGNVTDILLPNAVGQLPLTQPLRSLGVPDDVIKALDPLLRAIIETGYDRPKQGDAFPSEPVRFTLLPGPDQWAGDAQNVAAGAAETARKLGSLGTAGPAPSNIALRSATAERETPVDGIGVKQTKKATTPLLLDPEPVTTPPKKVSPPKSSNGGYRPGDVLRSVQNAVSSLAPKHSKPATSSGGQKEKDPAGASPAPDRDESGSTS